MSYNSNIKLIQNGEPVEASVANRPLLSLLGNTEYLQTWLRAMSAASAIFAKDKPVEAAAVVGQPVYYNTTTSRFERAYFSASSGDINSSVLGDSAQVWGLLHAKSSINVGDILLYGYSELDLTNAVDQLTSGSVAEGTWYLSPMGTGTLTQQRPMLAVPVVRTIGSNQVFVMPSFQDFDGKHRHHEVNLVMLPAGVVSPPSVGNIHTITSPDPSLSGWLPASHPVFNGAAPVGAKFGYNLAQDEDLLKVFPPVPLTSAAFFMQRPSIYDSAGERTNYGQYLLEDTVKLTADGIWWMTDCYDQVPWPTDYDPLSSDSASSSLSAGPCDPSEKLYSLKLYFTKLLFSTNNAFVQSLTSLDERLKITCSNGSSVATAGNLDIDLDLQLMQGSDTMPGSLVIKEFDAATSTFNRGQVLEGIRSTSPNVLLSGGQQVTLDGVEYLAGRVNISVTSEAVRELSSQLVRLDGVTEENFPVLYLGMPNDNTTSYVVKFEVPTVIPPSMQFRLRARLIGRAAGVLPPLSVEYYKVARPSNGLLSPVNVTQNYVTLSMNTVATVSSNQAVEATSAGIAVQPGDVVYVKVTRTPSALADTYNGEVGVMQQSGVLSST
jgi:hypothetical protein